MAFEAKDYPISDILTKSVFDIPRNQRRYVWKRDNWYDLFEDIVFSITQHKPHFVGSIVLDEDHKENGLTYYTIIDRVLAGRLSIFFHDPHKVSKCANRTIREEVDLDASSPIQSEQIIRRNAEV